MHLDPEVQLVVKLCVAEDEERCGCVQISALCRTPLGAGARGGDGSSTSLQLACWQWCPGPLDGCHMLGSVPNRWWACFNLQIFAIQLNSIDIYNNNSFICILMIRSYVTNKWVFHALWNFFCSHPLPPKNNNNNNNKNSIDCFLLTFLLGAHSKLQSKTTAKAVYYLWCQSVICWFSTSVTSETVQLTVSKEY